MPPEFRRAFYAGLAIALICGTWLAVLWRPTRQVRLHTEHLLSAVEKRDWPAVGEFLAQDYRDQWGNDRALLLEQLREGFAAVRALHVAARNEDVEAGESDAVCRTRIELHGGGEFAQPMVERVNSLAAPFAFRWRHASAKPWDWKLVGVSNPELELPQQSF